MFITLNYELVENTSKIWYFGLFFIKI